jgi:hypothetical protein
MRISLEQIIESLLEAIPCIFFTGFFFWLLFSGRLSGFLGSLSAWMFG